MILVRRKGALRRKNQEREESIECSILIRPICFSQLTPILGQWRRHSDKHSGCRNKKQRAFNFLSSSTHQLRNNTLYELR